MVSDVTLRPQGTPQGNTTATPVIRPTDTQAPSLRNVPRVSADGFREAQRAYSFIGEQAARNVDRIEQFALERQRERQIAQEEEDAAVFADVKAKAIRRAQDLASQYPFSAGGFDEAFDAYGSEVLATVPERLRTDLEVELFSIGTTKRSSIVTRATQQRVDNHRLAQLEAFDASLDEIVNSIETDRDFANAGVRTEQLKQQIRNSQLTLEQKQRKIDQLEGQSRDVVLFNMHKDLYETGQYHRIIPETANILEGPLGAGLNDFEKAEKAAQAFQYIEKLEGARRQQEADFEKAQKQVREDNYEALVEQLTDPNAAPITPEQVHATNLHPDKKISLAKIANGSDSGFDNGPVLSYIRDVSKDNPEAASILLSQAHAAGDVSNSTFLTEDSKLREQARRGGALSPDERNLEQIDAIGSDSMVNEFPMIGFTIAKAKQEYVVAMREYDETDQSGNPSARAQFAEQLRDRIIKEYIPINANRVKTTLKTPYGYTGTRGNITIKDIEESRARLIPLAKDPATKARALREYKELKRWEEILIQEQQ